MYTCNTSVHVSILHVFLTPILLNMFPVMFRNLSAGKILAYRVCNMTVVYIILRYVVTTFLVGITITA